ncbi:unannotated protein [freshwater metagenome]|uniref:DNA replication and repair protein RecF n=1 Tax=freshwater metagenome TaxID=449393 RepID=A0A6J6NFW6_9ZZZZ
MLFVGDNGAGKTNLLESLHLATQGFSPRTRHDQQLVAFGTEGGAVELTVRDGEFVRRPRVVIPARDAKRATLDGVALPSAESLRRSFTTLVFTPDRLAVVKGGPAARRAYLDRVVSRLFPARSQLAQEYGAALAQRNAALRRVQLGLSSRDAIEPWSEQVVTLGAALVEARREAVAALVDPFSDNTGALGLGEGTLVYEGEALTSGDLAAKLESDIARGITTLGPHLHDLAIADGARALRPFGSQGEQRLAVLALLLAEIALLPSSPLLLLDDVLSELDSRRRRVLAERVSTIEQTVITATHRSALPVEPAHVVEVTHGQAR